MKLRSALSAARAAGWGATAGDELPGAAFGGRTGGLSVYLASGATLQRLSLTRLGQIIMIFPDRLTRVSDLVVLTAALWSP